MSVGIVNPLHEGASALEAQAALLAELAESLARSLDLAETLRGVLTRVTVHLDAEAASIFLMERAGTELVCHDCVGPVDIAGLRLDPRQGIVGRVVRDRRCHMVRDVQTDPDFAASVDAGTGFVTRSLLCAPLIVGGECIGAVELVNKRAGDGLFDARDERLLAVIAAAAALAIHNARMAAALLEQEKVRRELDLAREIQESLLPRAEAGLPVVGINVPARVVSGDFYDFFALPDGRCYFNLADVSGKGIDSALLMAKTSSLFRCLAKTCADPGELLARVNAELCETATRGMFVTAVTGFLEPNGGRVVFANAGHQPVLARSPDGQWTEIPAEAPPLGVITDAEFASQTLLLAGGELYLYSDGVTESETGGRALGVRGLEVLVEDFLHWPPGERLGRIVELIERAASARRDDVTLLCVSGGPA